MHDQHRERRARTPCAVAEHAELVVHRVPVVIAVDERDVDRRQRRQHVVADVAVEDVPAGELLLVLGGVELGHGVDHVQLGVGPEPLEHQRGGLTAQGADLDDAARASRLQDRPDHAIPERIHTTGLALPVRRPAPHGERRGATSSFFVV